MYVQYQRMCYESLYNYIDLLNLDVCFGSRQVSWGVRRDNCYLFMCSVAMHRGTRKESTGHYYIIIVFLPLTHLWVDIDSV